MTMQVKLEIETTTTDKSIIGVDTDTIAEACSGDDTLAWELIAKMINQLGDWEFNRDLIYTLLGDAAGAGEIPKQFRRLIKTILRDSKRA